MSWKDRHIASSLQATAFLREYVPLLSDCHDIAWERCTLGPYWFTLEGNAEPWNKQNPSLFKLCMKSISSRSLGTVFALTNLRASGVLKSKGLGKLALKAALGIAAERKLTTLYLDEVTEDGPSFWSRWGAVPTAPPRGVGACLRETLRKQGLALNDDERASLEAIASRAATQPYPSWQELAQADLTSAQALHLRHHLFDRFCANSMMVFHLSDPATREILEHGLGRLPDFPAPEANRPARETSSGWPWIAQPAFS